MGKIQQNKLVLFGAGKIGRSFIGQLFSIGGYSVVFIDINKNVIDALNQYGHYRVIIKSNHDEVLDIKNVRGVHFGDTDKVVEEIATAGILAVSVGLEGLEGLFPLLAKGLEKRFEIDRKMALDIIIAENMRDADIYFSHMLKRFLPDDYPFKDLVGLVETSIGKMVPIMQKKDLQEDILQVFAEPYNTLILNKMTFKNPIPCIEGLAPKENMKAWVDRKLFIHNLGHSATAYIGYLANPRFNYLYEALADPDIIWNVRATMLQAAEILVKKYPSEFTMYDIDEHIHDLLTRFQNRALGDTIFRVGCDLKRKLGPEDRLAGALRTALEFDLPYDKILSALVCGCHFRATDEEGKMYSGDIDFVNEYENGIRSVLTNICGFDEISHKNLFLMAEEIDRSLLNKNVETADEG